jgi:hypothetical protein
MPTRRGWPRAAPSSTSAWRIHFDNVIGCSLEVGGELPDRHPAITITSNPNNVVIDVSGIRLGYDDILPAHPTGQAN